jgi:hypothetical protein
VSDQTQMSKQELVAWLESETAWRVRLEAQLAQADSDLAFANMCLESHKRTIDDQQRRLRRLETDIDALEAENATLEENARISASVLCGSIDIVTTWQDTTIRRLE